MHQELDIISYETKVSRSEELEVMDSCQGGKGERLED
jgi:hypothetical protein